MSSNNLSAQDVALYMGQQIYLYDTEGNVFNTAIVTGSFLADYEYYVSKFSAKLALRPLSSMTEEEKNELDELRIILRMGNMPIRVVNAYETRFYFSKGIDCLNWIESDLAIRKEE